MEGETPTLKSYGVEGELHSLLKSYIQNREQRVTLNGQTSGWREIKIPKFQKDRYQDHLFLTYINDLTNGITSTCKTFADDNSLF